MPTKHRLQKQKDRELQQAAQGSSSLLSWIRPSTSQTNDGESVTLPGPEEPFKDEEGQTECMTELCSGAATETMLPEEMSQEEGEVTAAPFTSQQGHVEERAVDESKDAISKIATKPYPTDPSHVEAFHIGCNESYIAMCCSVGPCQPEFLFPKNVEGRSFQKHWFSGNVWLEYSPSSDSMHCFSCRLFLPEDKYKSRKVWRNGIRKWNTALEKIKQHSVTEVHMTSMVRWTNYKKRHSRLHLMHQM